MTITSNDLYKFREILEQKVAQAAQVPRRRTDIAIERSPDQMDEVQYAADRELAIQNLDRESGLLRDLRAALRRIHDGTFGSCVQCESAISSKRLAAVPWDRDVSNAKRLRMVLSMNRRNLPSHFLCTPLKRATARNPKVSNTDQLYVLPLLMLNAASRLVAARTVAANFRGLRPALCP